MRRNEIFHYLKILEILIKLPFSQSALHKLKIRTAKPKGEEKEID